MSTVWRNSGGLIFRDDEPVPLYRNNFPGCQHEVPIRADSICERLRQECGMEGAASPSSKLLYRLAERSETDPGTGVVRSMASLAELYPAEEVNAAAQVVGDLVSEGKLVFTTDQVTGRVGFLLCVEQWFGDDEHPSDEIVEDRSQH
jgi:hypothetical protein